MNLGVLGKGPLELVSLKEGHAWVKSHLNGVSSEMTTTHDALMHLWTRNQRLTALVNERDLICAIKYQVRGGVLRIGPKLQG